MVKNGLKKTSSGKNVKSILITQPRPDSEKSPYFELAKRSELTAAYPQHAKLIAELTRI